MNRMPLAALCLALSAMPALADRIDGDWCSPSGQHVKIEGPSIEIPSGRIIAGQYDRHAFSYVGPQGDPEAGVEVFMLLYSDDEMGVIRKPGGEAPVTWKRCEMVS
ncbi:MAG: hypothetical protein WAT70_10150 [Rhizobiaceae bacterium]